MEATTRKCVVWDLDNTLWEGICLEGAVRLRPEAAGVLEVDKRSPIPDVEDDPARRQVEAYRVRSMASGPRPYLAVIAPATIWG